MINDSTNLSTGHYVFTPKYTDYFGTLIILPLLFGIIGLTGNATILYIIRKTLYSKKKNAVAQRTFGRPYLFKYFVHSLVISDILCSVSASAILSLQMLYDVRFNIWVCRFVRFPFLVFPFVTINNLVVISLERYYAVFHPFRLPSPPVIKMTVMFAWIVGAISATCLTAMVDIISLELPDNNWSLACFVNPWTPWQKPLFLFISILQYFVPNVIIISITLSIARFLHKRMKDIQLGKLHYVGAGGTWRFNGTKMFLKVFSIVSLPYLCFFGYNLIKSLLKIKLGYYNDFLVRYFSGFLALFNSSINPLIYSMNSIFLKTELNRMSRRIFTSPRRKLHYNRTEVYVIKTNTINSVTGV